MGDGDRVHIALSIDCSCFSQLEFLIPGGTVAPEAQQLGTIVLKAAAVRLAAVIAFDHDICLTRPWK